MKPSAVLFTGGKDSVYALHRAWSHGYDIRVLVSVIPHYEHSMVYHRPLYTGLLSQAQSMGIVLETIGVDDPEREIDRLRELVRRVAKKYGIKALITGAIKSRYQYRIFESIARDMGLVLHAPNWGVDEETYMKSILESGIEFMIISITSMGIPLDLLGKIFTWSDLERLSKRSQRYGFNLSFEGGEAETFVVNAPLFKYRLKVEGAMEIVSQYEGYFRISRIGLLKKQ